MVDRSYFHRFHTADATVSRPSGAHGPDGYQAGSATVILETKADMQRDGKTLQRHAAGYEDAGAVLFCRDDVADVEVGDSVDVTEYGRTVTGAVVTIRYDTNALVLDL